MSIFRLTAMRYLIVFDDFLNFYQHVKQARPELHLYCIYVGIV